VESQRSLQRLLQHGQLANEYDGLGQVLAMTGTTAE
jgi:hypothetical protein